VGARVAEDHMCGGFGSTTGTMCAEGAGEEVVLSSGAHDVSSLYDDTSALEQVDVDA